MDTKDCSNMYLMNHAMRLHFLYRLQELKSLLTG